MIKTSKGCEALIYLYLSPPLSCLKLSIKVELEEIKRKHPVDNFSCQSCFSAEVVNSYNGNFFSIQFQPFFSVMSGYDIQKSWIWGFMSKGCGSGLTWQETRSLDQCPILGQMAVCVEGWYYKIYKINENLLSGNFQFPLLLSEPMFCQHWLHTFLAE